MSDDRLLTPDEVAGRLKIGRTMVYELLEHGELPSIKIGRCRRIPASAVDTFIQRKLKEAADA